MQRSKQEFMHINITSISEMRPDVLLSAGAFSRINIRKVRANNF